jgi:F-type H+-transporting ATPase subunit b
VRRFGLKLLAVTFAVSLPWAICAQDHEKKAVEAGEKHVAETENSNEIYWKWANFIMLVGGLGYLISKYGSPLLAARTVEIQKGIQEATAARHDAEKRARDVDQLLAKLQEEVERLRQDARQEMAAEGERQRAETAAQLERLKKQGQQEIAAAAKAVQQELRVYSAQLALDLAETKIRQRLTPQTQDDLIRAFVGDLERNSAALQQKAN